MSSLKGTAHPAVCIRQGRGAGMRFNPNQSVGFETIFDLCQADFSVLFRRHSGLCQGKGRKKMPAEIEKRPKSLNKRANDRFGFNPNSVIKL